MRTVYTEAIAVVCGIIVMALGMGFLVSYATSGKSNIKSETINENMQKLSKSCIENHNGTFTVRFEHGDNNVVIYECTFGGN